MTTIKREHPLIGQAFHTQDENLITNWQGLVLADCGDGYFLAQLFDWFDGGPTTRHLFTLAEFAARHDNGNPRFRFFENMERANEYMETTAGYRDAAAARERTRHLDAAE